MRGLLVALLGVLLASSSECLAGSVLESEWAKQRDESTPVSEEVDLGLTWTHGIGVIKGTVWSFQENGWYAVFGGPIGLSIDRNTYFVSGSPSDLSLNSASDVMDVAPEFMFSLISNASRFCKETGYQLVDAGAAIHTDGDKIHLVEFCVPPGTTLPHFSKSGYRVP